MEESYSEQNPPACKNWITWVIIYVLFLVPQGAAKCTISKSICLKVTQVNTYAPARNMFTKIIM